jgi:hypothetical protein
MPGQQWGVLCQRKGRHPFRKRANNIFPTLIILARY